LLLQTVFNDSLIDKVPISAVLVLWAACWVVGCDLAALEGVAVEPGPHGKVKDDCFWDWVSINSNGFVSGDLPA